MVSYWSIAKNVSRVSFNLFLTVLRFWPLKTHFARRWGSCLLCGHLGGRLHVINLQTGKKKLDENSSINVLWMSSASGCDTKVYRQCHMVVSTPSTLPLIHHVHEKLISWEDQGHLTFLKMQNITQARNQASGPCTSVDIIYTCTDASSRTNLIMRLRGFYCFFPLLPSFNTFDSLFDVIGCKYKVSQIRTLRNMYRIKCYTIRYNILYDYMKIIIYLTSLVHNASFNDHKYWYWT